MPLLTIFHPSLVRGKDVISSKLNSFDRLSHPDLQWFERSIERWKEAVGITRKFGNLRWFAQACSSLPGLSRFTGPKI